MDPADVVREAAQMFERFTDRARRVLVLAQEESRLLGHSFIGTEHLLLGLIQERQGPAALALDLLGVRLQSVRDRVVDTIGVVATGSSGSPPFTPRAKKVLELALREALELGHHYIGTEHLLLGLVREGEGVAAQVLTAMGVDLEGLRDAVIELTGDGLGEGPPVGWDDDGGSPGAQVVDAERTTDVACSFCGRTPPRTSRLVSGRDAFICEGCIRRWGRRLGPRAQTQVGRLRQPGAGAVAPTGPPPGDVDAARAEIETAFAEIGTTGDDGRSVPFVERGETLGPVVALAKERDRHLVPERSDNTVDDVVFIDAGHAAVWFTIVVEGRVLVAGHRGDAVLVDGTWKVARATFRDLMGMAGVACPPDDS